MSAESIGPMWHALSDADLRMLHRQVERTGKTERATAIAAELARREAARNGIDLDDSFTAEEIAALLDIVAVLERHRMVLSTDGRIFLQVGKRRGMVFSHLDAGDVLAALGVGGPPSRVRNP
jgi:hypothetical protein